MEKQNVGPVSGSVEANVPAWWFAFWRGVGTLLALPFRYLWITVVLLLAAHFYYAYQFAQAVAFAGGMGAVFGLPKGLSGAPDEMYAALHWLAEPEFHQSLVVWAKGAMLTFTVANLLSVFGIGRFFWRKLRWIGVPVAVVVALLWSALPPRQTLVYRLVQSVQYVDDLRTPLWYPQVVFWGAGASGGWNGMAWEVIDLLEGKPFFTTGMERLNEEDEIRKEHRFVTRAMEQKFPDLPQEQWLEVWLYKDSVSYIDMQGQTHSLIRGDHYDKVMRGPYPFDRKKARTRKKFEEVAMWTKVVAYFLGGRMY